LTPTGASPAPDLAEFLDVHPNTVNRWTTGASVPHPHRREDIAERLNVPASRLWPEVVEPSPALAEILNAYPHRSDAPSEVWADIIRHGSEQVDFVGYAMGFVLDNDPRMAQRLIGLESLGARIRICLADPDCYQVQARDAEEQLNGTLKGRIVNSLAMFRNALDGLVGAEIRLHEAPLYNSVFRFGNQMLVTPHLYGTLGSQAPLLHLQRRDGDGLFDRFAHHFELIWASANPIDEQDQSGNEN
jgi:transcriptional regulator with XRE-family HTH domain